MPAAPTSPSQAFSAGVAVCFVYDHGASNETVTINGVIASQIGSYTTGHTVSLWQANVPAGSGTVIVTNGVVYGTFAVACGEVTTTHSTPTGFEISDMLVVAQPQSLGAVVTIPTNGVGIVFGAGNTGSGTLAPCTWTSATRDAVTEAQVTTSNTAGICGAHNSSAGSVTPAVAGANGNFGYVGSAGGMGMAAWGP